MTEQTITIYGFFHPIGRKDDAHCKVSTAKLPTIALLAARFFHGNLHSAYSTCRRIGKSSFARRLHNLKRQLVALFLALGQSPKELNSFCCYLMNSFPVAVSDNIRIPFCHLLQDKAYRGKCVSKRRYFYGFRVQVVTT